MKTRKHVTKGIVNGIVTTLTEFESQPQHTHKETCTTKNCKQLEKEGIDNANDYAPHHTPTPMGWVTSVMHESTRTLEEVAHFAGPNAGRVLRAVNSHQELVEIVKTVQRLAYQRGSTELMQRCKQAIAKAEGK